MKKKILLIDDEEIPLKSLYYLFQKEYNVIIANNAEEGLEQLKKQDIEVIVCDYQMPEITGLEFFLKIKNIYPDTIRILITAYNGIDEIIDAISQGDIFRYIKKPWNSIELKSVIREAFEKNSLIAENRKLLKQSRDLNFKEVSKINIHSNENINQFGEPNSILKAIIESTDSLVFSLDRNFCYTSFNSAHANIMKLIYDVNIELGKCIKDYQIPSDWKLAEKNYIRVLNGETVIDYADSGDELISKQYFEIAHYPIKDEKGNVIGISTFAKNTTERKKIEFLKLENEKFKELNQELLISKIKLENFKIALDEHSIVAITNVKGKIIYANDKFCKISKYTEEELLGQDHKILNSGYHPEEFFKNLWKTIYSKKIWKGDIKNKTKDGSFYWVSTTIVPNLDLDGNIYQFVAIRTDITKNKQNEEEIKSNEKFLRTITNVIPGMVGYWTKDLNCYFANNQYFDWFGKTWEEINGIQMKTLLGEELFLKNKPFIDRTLKGERVDFERSITKYNGNVGYTWSHYIPDIEDGDIKGFFVLISDITEIKKIQFELEKLNIELNEVNSTKDKFFSIIAHDLRSPFSGLLGLTQLLIEDDSTIEEMKDISKLVHDSSKELLVLVENLLNWARMQRGVIEYNPTTCDASFVVNQNIKIESEYAKQKSIELQSIVPAHLKIYADEAMINTVFRNLISNAIKFTHTGGKVIISAEENEKMITISIKDSGIGMSSNTLNKLFKIDEKVARKGTKGESSTGLGLLLCKDFIEKHVGKIWVESIVDKGSTFYFSLPKKL